MATRRWFADSPNVWIDYDAINAYKLASEAADDLYDRTIGAAKRKREQENMQAERIYEQGLMDMMDKHEGFIKPKRRKLKPMIPAVRTRQTSVTDAMLRKMMEDFEFEQETLRDKLKEQLEDVLRKNSKVTVPVKRARRVSRVATSMFKKKPVKSKKTKKLSSVKKLARKKVSYKKNVGRYGLNSRKRTPLRRNVKFNGFSVNAANDAALRDPDVQAELKDLLSRKSIYEDVRMPNAAELAQDRKDEAARIKKAWRNSRYEKHRHKSPEETLTQLDDALTQMDTDNL